MKVLITGAAGRIGRALAAGLSQDCALRLADLGPSPAASPGVEQVVCDVTDPGAVAAAVAGVDAVIHLAGHPNSADWDVVMRLNVGGTRTVIEAAVAAGVGRVLFASSIHVCGFHPADVAFDAALPAWPDSPYGVSKAMGETLLQYHADRGALTGFALRICSFRPAPGNARELATWLSPDDMVRLARACLTTDVTGYHALWGLSANTRARIDRTAWAEVGYLPQDDAEVHAPALAELGLDTSPVSEWPHLGGAFAEAALAGRPAPVGR